MVNYKCQRCGYETSHKSVFKKHLLRKYLCKPKMNDIQRFDLLILNGFDEESKMYEETAKITPKLRQNTPKKTITCTHCNKNFTRYDSLKKHLNGRCKLLKETNKDKQIKFLMDKDKEREKEMKKMMKLI